MHIPPVYLGRYRYEHPFSKTYRVHNTCHEVNHFFVILAPLHFGRGFPLPCLIVGIIYLLTSEASAFSMEASEVPQTLCPGVLCHSVCWCKVMLCSCLHPAPLLYYVLWSSLWPVRSLLCWTYSHHCQIADKNPSERWNGEFWGFRICIGFAQRDFVLWVFVWSINLVSLPATTPRATPPHRCLFRLPRRGLPRPYRYIQANRLPRLQGYHTRATVLRTDVWVQAGYHIWG